MSNDSGRKRPAPTSTFKVKVDDSGKQPIVCSFPGGLPASERDSSQQPPTFSFHSDEKRSTLTGHDEACQYTATATASEQTDLLTRTYIGVYNKKSGSLALYTAAANGTVFALQQSVPSYKRAAVAAASNLSGDRRALFEDFGSSKKKKVLRSQEANRVNVDSVVGAGSVMMNAFMAGEQMSESNRLAVAQRQQQVASESNTAAMNDNAAIENATKEWRKSFLPKFNETADEAHLVYDAKEIAGDAAWGQVSRVVDACSRQNDVVAALLQGPNRSVDEVEQQWSNDWTASVKEVVETVGGSGMNVKYQLKCAVLLNYFVNLFKKLHRKRFIRSPTDDRPRFFGAPLDIGHRFLELFTTMATGEGGESGHVMSKANKDKCYIHMLLLYVMAVGGKGMKAADIKPLADDVKIDVKDASQLLRLAGVTVKPKSGKTSAILKTPLTFPAVKRHVAKSR